MKDRSVDAKGDISHSIVVTGDGNHASIHFGADVTLPLARQQRLSKRHRPATADNLLPLLRADSLAFDVVGREEELAELRAWLDGDADISVQTLIGRAGTGKTRLAIELCRRIDGAETPGETAWSAGFLRPADISSVVDQLAVWELKQVRPALLVVDYASAVHRELAKWFDRLAAADFDGKLRFLLLEREAPEGFGWWHELAHPALSGNRADLFVADRPRSLPDLSDVESRRALFGEALEATSDLLGERATTAAVPPQGADPVFDEALGQDRFGNPLNLAMAGLIAAERGPRDALALRRLEAAREIARREARRMILLGESCDIPAAAMRQSLGFNGLAGGLPLASLRGDLAAELRAVELTVATDELPSLLERELPQEGREADDGAEPRLGTIQPDLVGEGVIIETLLVGPKSQLAAAAATFERALAHGGGRAAEALMRLLQDYGYAAEDPGAAPAEQKTGEELLKLLSTVAESIPDEDFLRLEPLVNAFPTSTIVLREAAAVQTYRLAQIWKAIADSADRFDEETAIFSQSRSAGWLHNLGNRLGDLGRREEALAVAQEAADIHRVLAAARPDTFEPYLASSLLNLANRLSDVGQPENALAVAQEAMELYRHLAAVRSDAFMPDVAMSLNNLANRLSTLGRREEALAAAQEAVDLYRALAAVRFDAFTPDLAMSLNNLANRLSDLDRRKEALAMAQDAVELYRHLAAARPDAFTPDVAMSLHNLSHCLSALGRHEEALRAAQDAVEIRRRLAAVRPDAFTPDVAMSLSTLAIRLSHVGRHEEALAAAQEAVEIRRRLIIARPDVFTPSLAASLNNLANHLSNLSRHEEALAAVQEAVEIRRRLAAARPDAFTPDLAMSLSVLGDRLEDVGRLAEAVQADHESIAALAPYFLAQPAPFARAMLVYLGDYLRRGQEAGLDLDEALVTPVLETLNSLQGEEGQ